MNNNILHQQFKIDFPGSDFTSHTFVYGTPTRAMRYWARGNGSIVIYKGFLLCRIDHEQLLNEIKAYYHSCQAQWFGEVSNLRKLESLLKKYGYTISNYAPFFIPAHQFELQETAYTYYEKEEILQFKGNPDFNECYSFDAENPDVLGVSHAHNQKIVAMAGMNITGTHTLEIGINVTPTARGQGLGASLVKALTARAQSQFPDKLVTYGTQFSHTQSINVAIRAGFIHGWTEIMIQKISE